MKSRILITVGVLGALLLSVTVLSGAVLAKRPVHTQLYYDGELVEAIIPKKGDGSDVTFKPLPGSAAAYPFDPIYVFVDANTGMPHAQPPIIGSVPGDKDYTGGRWQVFLIFGQVPADPDITSVADLMSSGLSITETQMYFECPVVGN